MKNTQKITKIIIIVVAVALIIWDIFVAAEPTPKDTISYVIASTALKHPIIPFAIGLLCGHFFFPIKGINNE